MNAMVEWGDDEVGLKWQIIGRIPENYLINHGVSHARKLSKSLKIHRIFSELKTLQLQYKKINLKAFNFIYFSSFIPFPLFSLIASRSALKNIFILNLSLKACTLQKWDDHQRMPLSPLYIIHIAAWNRGSEVVNKEEGKICKNSFYSHCLVSRS